MSSSSGFISEQEWAQFSEAEKLQIASLVAEDYSSTVRQDKKEEACSVSRLNSFYCLFGKRLFDFVVSGIALVLMSPINLLIACVTFFDVGSPILFKQKRIGKNGKLFNIYKFRNMTNETDQNGNLLPPKQRITKWGSFVRKTSLDELLNFWSIFKGDMSLIGPRPLLEKYGPRFSPYHQQRHLVRPGLECPFHDPALASAGWQGRLDNDVWYVSHVSLKTDLRMMILLVKKIFSREERKESAAGVTGEFIGYKPDGSVMNEFEIPRKYLMAIKEVKKSE